jgi:tetratricopeptide (TPR) repeat protein
MDLNLPEKHRIGGPQGWISINEWAMAQYVLSCGALGHRAEFLSYGESFLDRYPASNYHLTVSSTMNRMLEQMKKEEAGRGEVARVRVEAMGTSLEHRCRMVRDPVPQLEACRAWVESARAAGVEIDENAEETWAKAAARRGLIDEIERLHLAAIARDKYGEPAQDIGRVLSNARRDAEDADKALQRLNDRKEEGKERLSDYMRAANDSLDAGRFGEGLKLFEEAVERWPGENPPYAGAIMYHLNYGNPTLAEAWLARWEDAGEHGAEVDPSYVRRVRSYEEDTAYARAADALGLMTLGQKMNEAAQYRESADAYLRLAHEHPNSPYMPPSTALYMAGNGYRTAGMNSEAREVWEEAIRLYPDADIVGAIRSMMDTIPK